ncbi:RNA polymerase sigma-70 factor [Aureibaculum sp. 2210JD6-5]|uniref:RNA polymerase sigma factor n=1 Tax=Aureibaculum sp. 2210JD6-5 TaxID=3103957 RepID=UPI002AAE56E6|nr:RNA polymerase sigma-70 factor [Aureibaculum sp. 2210JD6-5]MDY7396753.1 RNA polymerase sigma-70 factor [Aureibaculum sp. 2210JD6-5]
MNINKDHFLIARLKTGDGKAYDMLMDLYYHKLCAYALSLTKDNVQAEDIVQNVIVKIWTKRKKIEFSSSLKNYLYRSVYNEFIDEFRKDKKLLYLEKKYLEALDLVIDDKQLDIDFLMNLVNKEIEQLPYKCKKIFILSKKEGLTHIEISEYLNISIKTVEGHITRAFKILNDKLGDKIKPILFLLFDFRNTFKSYNLD